MAIVVLQKFTYEPRKTINVIFICCTTYDQKLAFKIKFTQIKYNYVMFCGAQLVSEKYYIFMFSFTIFVTNLEFKIIWIRLFEKLVRGIFHYEF